MLLHSLYPGMVYVLTGKPCGHLVPFEKKIIKKNPNDVGLRTVSPSNSHEIEMLPMRSPKNLNRVSMAQVESDVTP